MAVLLLDAEPKDRQIAPQLVVQGDFATAVSKIVRFVDGEESVQGGEDSGREWLTLDEGGPLKNTGYALPGLAIEDRRQERFLSDTVGDGTAGDQSRPG